MTVQDIFKQCDKKNVAKAVAQKTLRRNLVEPEAEEKILGVIHEIVNSDASTSENCLLHVDYLPPDGEEDEASWDIYTTQEGNDSKYDVTLVPRSEQIGYSVDENCLSKYKLNDVAAAILWEITFFGWDEKTQTAKVKEHIEEIERIDRGIKDGSEPLYTWEEVKAKLEATIKETQQEKEKNLDK